MNSLRFGDVRFQIKIFLLGIPCVNMIKFAQRTPDLWAPKLIELDV